MQYMYEMDGEYMFMDQESFEQIGLREDVLGDALKYLKENMIIGVQFYQGTPIGVELPNFVELTIVKTDPGLRGDTATGGTKPATLETGAVVQVPCSSRRASASGLIPVRTSTWSECRV